ncbi:hypothetical protein LJR090_001465 [Bosea sp. LjRoot90]|uniref:hypothetical protein n=1 Tax=Bosea sp. LjRoot90 TaxID=3342342 RepID=UPI003ECF1F6A
MRLLKFEAWKSRNPDLIWLSGGQAFLMSQGLLSRAKVVSLEAELVYAIVTIIISFIGLIVFWIGPIKKSIERGALSQDSIDLVVKINIAAVIVWGIFIAAMIFYILR